MRKISSRLLLRDYWNVALKLTLSITSPDFQF